MIWVTWQPRHRYALIMLCPCNVHSLYKSFNEQTNYIFLLFRCFYTTVTIMCNCFFCICYCELNYQEGFPWKFPCFLQKKKVMCNIKQKGLHFVRLQKKTTGLKIPSSVDLYFLTKFIFSESVMDVCFLCLIFFWNWDWN